MELLQVDSIEQAIDKLLHHAGQALLRVEQLGLLAAQNRVLAEDILVRVDVPSFDRSTVDGYAVIAADTAAAGEALPCLLRLLGAVEMGQPAAHTVTGGSCVYVPTGGMLPAGADAVVMLEYCDVIGSQVAVGQAVSVGRNVVYRGADLAQGSLAIGRGQRLGPAELGLLAALGYSEVPVYARARLAVFSSGDEVAPPTFELKAAQVCDINSYAVTALAREAGFDAHMLGIVPDDADELTQRVRAAMQEYDVVVISGGSSQGARDHTAAVIDSLAAPGVLTHGLAIKPGKPTIVGYDAASTTVLVGLPGHPVSAMLVFTALLRDWWQGLTNEQPAPPLPATLTRNLPAAEGKTTYQTVRLSTEQGALLAEPIFFKSGLISSLVKADGYIILEKNSEGAAAGSAVLVHQLRR